MKKFISFILSVCLFATTLCGCENAQNGENYFGGKGEFSESGGVLRDEKYIYFGGNLLKKFNTETGTLSVACEIPGCDHSENNPNCKAHGKYFLFNGNLLKKVDEIVSNPGGKSETISYLYLCDTGKQVFKNDYPDSFTDEDKKTSNLSIGVIQPLSEDNLALVCSGFVYILDKDFNIKFTISDMGSYSGGIYFYNNEIYYIDNLYRLLKLDETGETSAVNSGSMKITEGEIYGDKLWFSNEEQSLCSYDFKSGEIKERAKNAVKFTFAGHYLEYLKPNYSENENLEVHLFDLDTGENKIWELAGDNTVNLYFIGEKYYIYDGFKDNKLLELSADLSEIQNVYELSD